MGSFRRSIQILYADTGFGTRGCSLEAAIRIMNCRCAFHNANRSLTDRVLRKTQHFSGNSHFVSMNRNKMRIAGLEGCFFHARGEQYIDMKDR